MTARRVVRWAPVLVVVLLVAGFVLVYDGTVFDDPPDDWVVYRAGDRSLRHPPGWSATRTPDGADMRPATSPEDRPSTLVTLRVWGDGPVARERARAAAERLVPGRSESGTAYDIDVPGSDKSSASDTVFRTRDGTAHRVTTVFASRDGFLTTLSSRGRVTNGPQDPRDIAGTLRLDGGE